MEKTIETVNQASGTEVKDSSKRKEIEGGWNTFGEYMSRKQEKLWAQYERGKEFEPRKTDIFSGVCIFVNGYTDPPSDELRRLMQQHGGEYHLYETSRTTHVIASNLCHAKMVQVKPTDKIVKPQWITDSIKEGRLLPDDDYRLVKGSQDDALLKFITKDKLKRTKNDGFDVIAMDHNDNSDFQELPDGQIPSITAHQSNAQPASILDDQPSTSSKNNFNRLPSKTSISRAVPTAGDPNFVKDYYSRSRLHFISTWAREMKNFVDELKSEADSATFRGLEKLRGYLSQKRNSNMADNNLDSVDGEPANYGNVFMHLDMDCFFVSVGLRKRPDLRGQPIAVAHSSGVKGKSTITTGANLEGGELVGFSSCSDIASCSYEARACGVRNGMWLGEAKKLCPNLKTIPYDFEEYHNVSKKMYTIVASYTLQIEPVSCDEVYVDITNICQQTGATPLDVATVIRKDIFDQCQCPSSAGLGTNMLLARLATKRAKPNGQYFISTDEVTDFMAGQKLSNIPGVGYEGQRKLEALNVETCEQLWALPLSILRQHFGAKTAETLYKFSKGIDDRKIKSDVMRKSVSCDMNYGIRFTEKSEVHKFLKEFSVEVASRLKKSKIRSPNAPVEPPKFLGTGMCDAVSRSTTLFVATDDCNVIAKECSGLLDQISPVIPDLRGIGVSIQKLEQSNSGGFGTIRSFIPGLGTSTICQQEHVEDKEDGSMSVITLERATDDSVIMIPAPFDGLSPSKRNDTVTSKPKVSPSRLPVLKLTQPTLFDQSNYEDIKRLLIDWAEEEYPCNTDAGMVSHYFSQLIDNLDLCNVRTSLSILQEQVSRKQCKKWSRAYNAIVGDVQKKMISRYGRPLRIRD